MKSNDNTSNFVDSVTTISFTTSYTLSDGESVEQCELEDLLVDHTVVVSSLVEEFTFLCGSEWKRTIYSALYMFGMLFGSYFFGWLVNPTTII